MNWKKARIIFYAISLVSGLFFLTATPEDSFVQEGGNDFMFSMINIVLNLAMLFFIYPGLLMVIGVQAINPLSDRQWHPPDHSKNPFKLGQPIYFFHFAVFSGIFYSIGILISVLWNGWVGLFSGLFLLFAFCNVLWAVNLCMHVYKNKFQQGSSPA